MLPVIATGDIEQHVFFALSEANRPQASVLLLTPNNKLLGGEPAAADLL
jgi:hypothetical protein